MLYGTKYLTQPARQILQHVINFTYILCKVVSGFLESEKAAKNRVEATKVAASLSSDNSVAPEKVIRVVTAHQDQAPERVGRARAYRA